MRTSPISPNFSIFFRFFGRCLCGTDRMTSVFVKCTHTLDGVRPLRLCWLVARCDTPPACYLHGRRLHSSFFWSSPRVLVWTVRISCALASHCSLDHPHLWKQQKHNQHCTQQQHTLSLGSNHGLAAPCSLQVHVRRPSFRQSGGATGPSDGSTYNTQLYMSHIARMDGVHGANCIHVPHFSLAAYYRLQPRLIADVG